MPPTKTKYTAPTRRSKRSLNPSVRTPAVREVTDYQSKRKKRWVVASIMSIIFLPYPTLMLILFPLLPILPSYFIDIILSHSFLHLFSVVAKGLVGSDSRGGITKPPTVAIVPALPR